MNLYLPLEIKNRDLNGRLLVAYYAIRKGFHVYLFPKYKIKEYLKVLPKGIFIYFGIVPNYTNGIQNIKKRGHVITAWDEEGFVFLEKEDYLRCRISKDVYDSIDTFFTWGEYHHELVKKKLEDNSKLVIAGHPRFDLLKSDYRNIFTHKVEKIKDRFGKFILVNSRFGSYNHFNGLSFALEAKRNKGYFYNDERQDFYKRMIEFDGLIFNKFLEAVKYLAQKFPNNNIIIRPHPSENFNTWNEQLHEHSNVKIISDGNAIEWILASEILIHNGCTTGIEAFLLNKTTVAYKPVKSEEFDIFLPNFVSIEIDTIEKLYEVTSNAISGRIINHQEDKLKLLVKYLYNLNANSTQRIMIEISRLSSSINVKQNRNIVFLLSLVNNKIAIKEFIRNMLMNKSSKDYIRHKLGTISKNEITDTLNYFNKSHRENININVSSLGNNSFKISRKDSFSINKYHQ